MMENLYRETVTIRRPRAGTGAVDGSVQYEIVLGEGDLPVEVRCALERRSRRIFSTQNVEIQSDATLLFRQQEGKELRNDDIVVDSTGAAWKVVGLNLQKMLFGSRLMGRADLQTTVNPVPHNEEVSG